MDNLLHIRDLKFSWLNNKKPLLDIEDFAVQAGDRIFLHGPSGSGKSTLLNLIAGVLVPQQGKIEILKTNLSELSSGQRDQFRGDHMGFIFQMFNLLPYFSAIENVTLPSEFSKKKSKKVLSNTKSLKDEAYRLLLELKLDAKTLENKKVTQLSVGQQQRVATARALMGRPELIIADEPTSALDRNIRDDFLKLLFNECDKFGTTLIFVSHDQDLGKMFDRVVSLKEINRAEVSDFEEKEIKL
ncbi:MAG TPA: ABC transporter ATP-binding protein [Oligoflexia bacterium]|nr:ABC transporter ATP-binding protein [Oligoflexia bacterium]HMR24659.1 ABC transporter ATP-binding protein [Oligoflexia bacterium]